MRLIQSNQPLKLVKITDYYLQLIPGHTHNWLLPSPRPSRLRQNAHSTQRTGPDTCEVMIS